MSAPDDLAETVIAHGEDPYGWSQLIFEMILERVRLEALTHFEPDWERIASLVEARAIEAVHAALGGGA